ncbi:universal stress protein [Arenibaculum pallidiluteum]|uniref:universal stress protein n=1 Tax=Arenibaculum pallidiluteum TaxID=2812559 RepID=UPI001A96F244|nr:universal stress protein [Arenibaculum pallidiluteum]
MPPSLGDEVAVAWDGGSAAARAVAAALPFLHRADRIRVLAAEVQNPSRSADPHHLAEYLGLHGVAASVHPVAAADRAVSRALVETAASLGCDLLVMGAYGHSRLREMMRGGVTQDILRAPQALPILMAH